MDDLSPPVRTSFMNGSRWGRDLCVFHTLLELAHCGETEREQKAFAAILSLDTPCGQRGRKKLRTLSGAAAATKCRKGRSKFHFRTMREGLLNDDVIEHGVAKIVAACVDLISEILLIHELSQSIQRHITIMESRFNESALTKVFRLIYQNVVSYLAWYSKILTCFLCQPFMYKSLCAFACFSAFVSEGLFHFAAYTSPPPPPPPPRNAETAENVHVGRGRTDRRLRISVSARLPQRGHSFQTVATTNLTP